VNENGKRPKPKYQVTHYSEVKYAGTKLECYMWLADEVPGTIENAMKSHGWGIEWQGMPEDEDDLPENERWKAEWQGMPEFIQEAQEPYSKIIVRFANKGDLREFAEMIGQELTIRTKSIWHPKLARGINSTKRLL
jgi:hypothetical protein